MPKDWDDDEWDEEQVTKAPLKGSWDEESEDDEPPPPPAAKAKAKGKAEAKAKGKAEEPKAKAAASAASAPASKGKAAAAEPKVEQKVVTKDSMEELEITLQQHVDTLVKLVTPKLTDATAKQAPAKFLADALRGLQLKLSLQEAEQLQKTCKEMHTKRKKQDQEAKKKKLEEEEKKKKEENLPKNEVADDDFFSAFM